MTTSNLRVVSVALLPVDRAIEVREATPAAVGDNAIAELSSEHTCEEEPVTNSNLGPASPPPTWSNTAAELQSSVVRVKVHSFDGQCHGLASRYLGVEGRWRGGGEGGI